LALGDGDGRPALLRWVLGENRGVLCYSTRSKVDEKGCVMQFRVKSLCESGEFSKAIDVAKELPDHDNLRLDNLDAISVEILKQEKGDARDIDLGKLFFAFANAGAMEKAMELLKDFHAHKFSTRLQVWIEQVVARQEDSIRSGS